MKLFGEKVKHTFTNSPHNILQIKDYNEIFFDVYEIELNNGKYPVEKISEESGMPVVSIPIIVEGVEREVSFVLTKGKENIIFLNEENENLVNSSDLSEKSIETVEMHIDIPQILREDVEEVDQPLSHIQESKREILDQIEEAKKQAIKQASKIKKRKLEEANSEISEKKKALDVMLESARNSLVDEFLDISKKIKNEFISENDNRWEEIQETIDNKIEDISSSLSESLKEDFSTSEKQFDGKIRELVKELYNSLQPKIDNDLKDIAKQIVEKVNVIENNLTGEFEKIDERFQKNLSNVEENITEIALDMSGKVNSVKSELNEKFNKIDKNVNKSLSRVGLLDKKIDTAVYTISEEIDNKIQQVENDIEKSCNDKLELLESKNFDINDKNRKYLIDLITESKHGLIEEVRKISKQAPIEYVVEANNTKKNINQDDIIKDLEKKINFLVGDVETRLRKYVAVYGGGGGTVATQYQDGGIMNGDLTINGNTTFNGNNTIDGNSSITGNVSIEGAITSIDSIQFDKAASITVEQGELAWNAEDLTLDLGLDTNVTLQLGQEQVIRVKCADPLGVFDGMPVYAYGTTGGSDNIEIKRYSSAAGYGVDELYFIGVATEDIAFNGVGFVTTFGRVREVDGRAYGTNNGVKDPADSGNWVFGDVLYVSPNIAGTLTRIIPESPDARIPVAMILKAPNQSNVTLMVRAEHGYHLTELHDVYARTPNNGDVLAYNASNSRWENTSNISVSSLSATTIHALSSFVEVIDIKQYELSGFNVAGNATVQGSISATGDLTVDTDTLYVDSADSRVGIGTTNPLAKLHVEDSTNATVRIGAGTRRINLDSYASNWNYQTSNGAPYVFGTADSYQLLFYQNNQERMRIQTNGNVGIGTTDPSEKLTVSGNISASGSLSAASANITGDLTVDTNTLYVDSTNNFVGINNSSPDRPLSINQIADGQAIIINGYDDNSSKNLQIYIHSNGRAYFGGTANALVFAGTQNYFTATGSTYFDLQNATSKLVIRDSNYDQVSWLDSNGGAWFSGDVGIGTDFPNAKLEVNGTVIVQDDADFNGTENTMPNQTLGGGDASVITLETLLRSEANYGWSAACFSSVNEQPATALLSPSEDVMNANMLTSAGALSGYSQAVMLNETMLNYPSGSGTSNRFADNFSLIFDCDHNDPSENIERWFFWGRNLSDDPTIAQYPAATEKWLGVRRYNSGGTEYIQVIIADGSGTFTQSSPEVLGTHHLHNKTKCCIVWDGATLSFYGRMRFGYGYSDDSWNLNLIAQTTYVGTLPTATDNFRSGWMDYLVADNPTGGRATTIYNTKFIRRAVHPI